MGTMLTVKLSDQLLKEFDRACKLRGSNMSARVREWIIDYVEQQKERYPEAFLEQAGRSGKRAWTAKAATSGHLMSMGSGPAPSKRDRSLAAKDIKRARKVAREDQKHKRND